MKDMNENDVQLESVTDRNRIAAMLAYSKEHGTTLGIHSPALGSEIYMMTVENISSGDDQVITVKSHDSSGYILGVSTLKLTDIRCVYPFQSIFENPYVKNLYPSRVA